MKTIGVLGGMGPYASIRFYEMLIEKSIHLHKASRNADFPHILIDSIPVPDLISDRDNEEETVRMIEKEIECLEKAGAEFLVLTCNTMHLYADRFRSKAHIPFLSMIDVVVDRVAADALHTVGVLGSPTTMQSSLYSGPLQQKNIQVLSLTKKEQDAVVAIIQRIIAGKREENDRRMLATIVNTLAQQGAEAVILGCTELPLLLQQSEDMHIPIYDSLALLAQQSCEEIYRQALTPPPPSPHTPPS